MNAMNLDNVFYNFLSAEQNIDETLLFFIKKYFFCMSISL
jgi:hypothetical protein